MPTQMPPLQHPHAVMPQPQFLQAQHAVHIPLPAVGGAALEFSMYMAALSLHLPGMGGAHLLFLMRVDLWQLHLPGRDFRVAALQLHVPNTGVHSIAVFAGIFNTSRTLGSDALPDTCQLPEEPRQGDDFGRPATGILVSG